MDIDFATPKQEPSPTTNGDTPFNTVPQQVHPPVVPFKDILVLHARYKHALSPLCAEDLKDAIGCSARFLSQYVDGLRSLDRKGTKGNEAAAVELQRLKENISAAAFCISGDYRSIFENVFGEGNADKQYRLLVALKRFTMWSLEEIEAEESTRAGVIFLGSVSRPPPGGNREAHEDDATVEANKVVDILDFDLNSLFTSLLESSHLPEERLLLHLLKLSVEHLSQEPNVVCVEAPCTLVGDIHGQLLDLRQNILKNGGALGEATYVFLGDYVDRGPASIHCMALLLCAKLKFPDKVMIIRGNHESRQTNSVYGFLNEIHKRYPTSNTDGSSLLAEHPVWSLFNDVFDAMPLAAVVSDRIFCVHGGLSPKACTIDAMLCVNRRTDADSGVLADLTWSDPSHALGFNYNVRGCGQHFGEDISDSFVSDNNVSFICRAHQCVKEGYKWTHSNRVLTLFSAPNYCGLGNDGAILKLKADMTFEFIVFGLANCDAFTPEEVGLMSGEIPHHFQQ